MPLNPCKDSLKLIEENHHLTLDRTLYLAAKKGLDGIFIANQIKGRKKIQDKVPYWKNFPLIFPVTISMEQCSSEKTAVYKSSLIKGESVADLTGGFGVDTYFMSKLFKKTIYCEQNADLFEIVNYNFKKLNCSIETHKKDGIEFIKKLQGSLDCIYIDPSRRNEKKERVHQLEDYSPNVIKHFDLLFDKTSTLLMKTSPFLEPKDVISKLKFIKEIHVVSFKNDCKEVLYLMRKDFQGSIKIHATDLESKSKFIFEYEDELNKCDLNDPIKYLYEPNSAVLKAGSYESVGTRFGLFKLNRNSHLYTSEEPIENFPGRRFEIVATTNYNSKEVLKYIHDKKANISKRNFPYSTDEIRKKLKLKDGGDIYLFATTLKDNKKAIIICRKY
jgi:16S rRNA G966 N2-methylase RsmD